jgi:predicted Rdx family selenoprotein
MSPLVLRVRALVQPDRFILHVDRPACDVS